MTKQLTSRALARVVVSACVELASQEGALNSLNVFPVPDGDTGSNMRATLQAGLTALEEAGEVSDSTPEDAVRWVVAAMTRGAQGNSGVILSEYLRGCASGVVPLSASGSEAGVERGSSDVGFDGDALARALHAGARAARGAVESPVEGTVLSVADAAAAGAATARSEAVHAGQSLDVDVITAAALAAAQAALARSPQQLAVLSGAGVVDAGGAGLVLVLECLHRVASGRFGLPQANIRSWLKPASGSVLRAEESCQVVAGGPGFELMGVVDGLDDEAATTLRRDLAGVGESVVVAGGVGVHRVHVHTDAVLVAASLMRAAGRLSAPSVIRFEGPLAALADVEIDVRDGVLRRYAEALGCASGERARGRGFVVTDRRDESSEPEPEKRRAKGAPSPAQPRHAIGGRTTVQVLETLDELAMSEAALDAEHLEEFTVYQTSTWGAARDLVRSRFSDAELVTVLVEPEAKAREVAAFEKVLAELDADVVVLRLDSGALVQMGLVHA